MSTLKDDLRQGMRRLAAGVCVISTQLDGRRYAMTASSVTSVSDAPASLLVCVNREASMQPILTFGQKFVINVLSYEQQDISNLCAGREGDERFSVGDWKDNEQGIPFLQDAQVSFFCHVDNEKYCYGTHQIVIGCLDQVVVNEEKVNPLVYLDGAYHSL